MLSNCFKIINEAKSKNMKFEIVEQRFAKYLTVHTIESLKVKSKLKAGC